MDRLLKVSCQILCLQEMILIGLPAHETIIVRKGVRNRTVQLVMVELKELRMLLVTVQLVVTQPAFIFICDSNINTTLTHTSLLLVTIQKSRKKPTRRTNNQSTQIQIILIQLMIGLTIITVETIFLRNKNAEFLTTICLNVTFSAGSKLFHQNTARKLTLKSQVTSTNSCTKNSGVYPRLSSSQGVTFAQSTMCAQRSHVLTCLPTKKLSYSKKSNKASRDLNQTNGAGVYLCAKIVNKNCAISL